MVVLDSRLSLTRKLYTSIDAASDEFGKIEVHISHLPSLDEGLSSLWAEIALDGIVLYERDFILTRICPLLRYKIAAGEYVRKSTHGQSYWVQKKSHE